MGSMRVRHLIVAAVWVSLWAIGPGEETVQAEIVFGTPRHLEAPVNTVYSDGSPSISADELSLYFDSNRFGGSGSWDLWVATRPSWDAPWESPRNVGGEINTWNTEAQPEISADGLSLFFISNRAGGFGSQDLWVARRSTRDASWGTPVNLGATVNSQGWDGQPNISADGLELYFHSDRFGGFQDLWVTWRETIDSVWEAPVNLRTVNGATLDQGPGIASNGLALFLESDRRTGVTRDIYVSTRPTVFDSWQSPIYVQGINSTSRDADPELSFDGRTLYFTSHRVEGFGYEDLWQAPLVPIVDFNGDGQVDGAEITKVAGLWGQNDLACDVAPFPFGDGIVGVEDLVVLAEYIGAEIVDPTLVTHWALDEAEGVTARDSVSGSEGLILGDAIWQPVGGAVNGALEFDGTDDCVLTNVAINPSDGPLSVFAWIQGGHLGQVIIAQETGANWLRADTSDGSLMTQLASACRFGGPLSSQTPITDGRWHRIGFTWDGAVRTLYVDDIPVAEDAHTGLSSSHGQLYIGAGADLADESLWSGLIDEVRIYNRCVYP